MNDRQHRALLSYRNVLAHLDDRATSIAPEAAAIVAHLKNTVGAISEYSSQQYVAQKTRHVTAARREIERMRKEQMLPLARLARRVFAGESRIVAALRVPHKRAATDAVLAASSLIVTTLRPHRKVLSASNIDPSRLDRLHVETRRLKKVCAVAYGSSADRAMPTRRLRALFAAAHTDVLTLDALVSASRSKSGALEWKIMSRVGKRIGRPRRSRRGTHGDKQVA